MVTKPGRTLRLALFGLLLWTIGAVNAFAQFGDPFASGTAFSNGPLELAITTNKGNGAVFQDGDPITIYWRAGKAATLTLVNYKPTGSSTLVSNLNANAGWIYRIDSFVGVPLGSRLLRLSGRSGNVTDTVDLTLTVTGAGSTPIIAHVSTNRGCGSDAIYQRGEPLVVTFSVEENATVRVVNMRPDGEVVLRENFQAEANVVYPLDGNAGSLTGDRKLVIDATAGSRTGQATCTFKVVDALPVPPLIARLETDKGCGSGAVYREGDIVSFLFQLNETASVRLTITLPNGTQSLVDSFMAQANTLYRRDRFVGSPDGARTATLVAQTATRTETQQCNYEVSTPPLDNSIVIALSTNLGPGPNLAFRTDGSMAVDFTVSDHGFLRMRMEGATFTQTIISNYEVEPGRRYRFIFDVGEPPGARKIIVDVKSGEHGGQAQLAFDAVH